MGTATSAPTVESLLVWGADQLRRAGVDNPRLEAQLLLAHVLKQDRTRILIGLTQPVHLAAAAEYEVLIRQRASRVPLAYIRGYQEFYGLAFEVTPATLIPRPETELLVEVVLQTAPRQRPAMLVDVCTGSGCVAIACAVHAPALRIVASDLSPEALSVAARNAARHGVQDRVRLVVGDTLDMLATRVADLVVANPPYIPSREVERLQPEIRDYEPRLAVDGGLEGMSIQRRIIADARRVLQRGGILATEVALGQADQVARLMMEAGYIEVDALPDLAGVPRVVRGTSP